MSEHAGGVGLHAGCGLQMELSVVLESTWAQRRAVVSLRRGDRAKMEAGRIPVRPWAAKPTLSKVRRVNGVWLRGVEVSVQSGVQSAAMCRKVTDAPQHS